MLLENICTWILLLFSVLASCQGQVSDPCNNSILNRCDVCIAAAPECVWCPLTPDMMPEFSDPRYENLRCRSKSTLLQDCPMDLVVEGPDSSLTITQQLPLSRVASGNETTIQVTPQNVSLKLRIGEPQSFNMTFISLPNIPLDLYFLFDFSSSLASVISTLKGNVENIIREVDDSISTAYQVGLGGFVEKPTLPFASTSNYRYDRNDMRFPGANVSCDSDAPMCEPAYAYRHLVSITRNTTEFDIAINNVIQSGNLDNIEDGLEAMLQASVCKDIIGWRSRSLRMLLIFTDQGYHIAGDGKLAGITRPNDGKCHLVLKENKDGSMSYEYSDSLAQDYPSVRQVGDALLEANIIPVFVIVASSSLRDTFLGPYIALRDELTSIRGQAIWFNKDRATDFQAIVDVIQTSYDASVQGVRVNPQNVPGYNIDIVPVSGCDNFDSVTGECGIRFNEEVTFQVTVTLEDCSIAEPTRINLRGGGIDFTSMDIEPLCSCNCTESRVENSSECSFGGDLECGACVCHTMLLPSGEREPIRFGETCQCDEAIGVCPSIGGELCSGNGICDDCGQCQCRPGSPIISGDVCQCTNETCPIGTNGEICSGRGECDGDSNQQDCACTCEVAPFSGRRYYQNAVGNDGDCRCNPDDCYNPAYPNVLCASPDDTSVSGNCACDGCLCPSGLFAFNNACRNQTVVCNTFEEAARCNVSQTSCSTHNVTYITLLTDQDPPGGAPFCTFVFNECTYDYYVEISGIDAKPKLHISEDIQCPLRGIPGWIFAVIAVVVILLLGLLVLFLIKLSFIILDRIEYKRFQANLKNTNFSQSDNPLYISPTQDYKNPLRKPSLLKKPSFL